MNMKSKSIARTAIALTVFSLVLLTLYYYAFTYTMKNLNLFAFMIIGAPGICLMAAAFLCGYFESEWNWKRSLLVGIILAALTFCIGTLSTNIFHVSPDSLSEQEALMNELYEELDRKAYEAMLEQGLISEGEKIYSSPLESNSPGTDSEIAYSELYVGLGKSDTVSEILSIIIHILLAAGAGFAGARVKKLKAHRTHGIQ